ncbi:alpha/beta hydrolase family protein [Spirillospora albida]|uniref:alpha/beta hydrolase family protein n=1 Tax=Spirillospora albida TaxID=58123 RepID=UPI0004BF4AC1|nr:alpha/beta hydrolase [Spirillospora albida]
MRIRALAVVTTVLAALAPAAAHADPVPDDRPLPGYTIQNPVLPPVQVNGEPSRVLQGVHRHAAYDIEVPPRWNGRLALYAHGYAGQGKVLTVSPPPYGLRQRLLDQGFAWAASSYYANGYDVRAGVLGTRDLADLFTARIGRPRDRVIVGVSMGGHVAGRSIEQYPGYYSGALPMCGVLGDNALFDYLLDYNLAAQALSGVREYPVTSAYATVTVPKIQAALGLDGLRPGGPDTTNDRGKQFRTIVTNRTGGPRPGADAAFAVWKDFPFTLASPSLPGAPPAENPGQVATNLFTRYTPNTPFDVNAAVQRVRPENLPARLSNRLSHIPRVNGRPTVPVLTLHNLGDLFVPFSMEQVYASETARHHRSGLLVQRAIRAAQHCEFTPAEAARAWDDLIHWIDTGKRPAGDTTTNPKTVATPTYGCRFTDKAAYTSGTRPLYPPCP